jgi:hypothetical protein
VNACGTGSLFPGEIAHGFSEFFLDGVKWAVQFIRKSEGAGRDPSVAFGSLPYGKGKIAIIAA